MLTDVATTLDTTMIAAKIVLSTTSAKRRFHVYEPVLRDTSFLIALADIPYTAMGVNVIEGNIVAMLRVRPIYRLDFFS